MSGGGTSQSERANQVYEPLIVLVEKRPPIGEVPLGRVNGAALDNEDR